MLNNTNMKTSKKQDNNYIIYKNIIYWNGISKVNYKEVKKNKYNYENKLYFMNKLFLINMRSGNKLTVFKHFELFYKSFTTNVYYEWHESDEERSELVKEYITSNNLKYLEKIVHERKIKHEFYSIFNSLLPEYDSLFNMKIVKLSSELRKKYRRKYTYKIVYVPFEKRIFLTLQFLRVNSFALKHNKLSDRFFRLFFNFILEPRRILAWQRRELVYDLMVKKYKKIN